MDEAEKIICVILNYNDAQTVCALVRRLEQSQLLKAIVLVDNASTDGSWEKFRELEENSRKKSLVPIHLLRADHNGGYGAGNQLGINYAVRYLNPDYIIVANPDIEVGDRCMLRVKEALELQENGAVASAMVMSPTGAPLLSYWDLLPVFRDLLDTGPLTRRLFCGLLLTPLCRLPRGTDKNSRLVGAVPGSFFMIKVAAFSEEEIRQLFDEKIFLYYEEKTLGQKLRARGKKEVLVTDESYVHAHSVSVSKSIARMWSRQKILHESKLYYYKQYLHAGPLMMCAARVFLAAVLLEVWIATGILRIKNGNEKDMGERYGQGAGDHSRVQ